MIDLENMTEAHHAYHEGRYEEMDEIVSWLRQEAERQGSTYDRAFYHRVADRIFNGAHQGQRAEHDRGRCKKPIRPGRIAEIRAIVGNAGNDFLEQAEGIVAELLGALEPVEAERQSVVSWLRSKSRYARESGGRTTWSSAFYFTADAIERGEHRCSAETEDPSQSAI